MKDELHHVRKAVEKLPEGRAKNVLTATLEGLEPIQAADSGGGTGGNPPTPPNPK